MPPKALTVTQYLSSLPEDRRKALSAVREVINKKLPKGYRETMQYGVISYVVPLERYPQGYLGKKDMPLPFVSVASQKNHMAVYLMCVYGDPKLRRWFEAAWKKTGKKLHMGKSCLRFKGLEDVALDVLGEAVSRVPVQDWIEIYESSRGQRKPASTQEKRGAKGPRG